MSLSADATLLTRGRDPYVIAAALLLDEILAGELDVEGGRVDGEPIADWIDRFSRIAPPRIIADLVRQGSVTPRRFSLSVDARAEAEARSRADDDSILGALLALHPLPPSTHTLPPAVQNVLSAVRVSHIAFT
ncbi:hypothetical protein OJ998_06895 [Solirubrobacter taibaiensis]|nr:hypothetical protein [Solirubrobacter taibaiensis]